MAIRGFMESSLGTSEIYGDLSNMGDSNTTEKAKNLIKTAKHLTSEDIEAAYISVKQISDSLTRAAIKGFEEGKIVLIYNNVPANAVTQALPFITFKTSDGYKTYVFMDKYISINRDGVMSVQSPILRDLLTGALISNGIKTNYNNLASSPYFQTILTDIYVKCVIRILNREYSIMADKVISDTLQYWISKFFLINILGSNDTQENIESISKKGFKYIDDLKYNEIKEAYETANPNKISQLLELIKTASPRMKTLGLDVFISNWLTYYYIPSMLAIDNIEYLMFMIITLLTGDGIVSISASDIVKEAKNIKSFRSELLKLI